MASKSKEISIPGFSADGLKNYLWINPEEGYLYLLNESTIPLGGDRIAYKISDLVNGTSSLDPERVKLLLSIIEKSKTYDLKKAAKPALDYAHMTAKQTNIPLSPDIKLTPYAFPSEHTIDSESFAKQLNKILSDNMFHYHVGDTISSAIKQPFFYKGNIGSDKKGNELRIRLEPNRQLNSPNHKFILITIGLNSMDEIDVRVSYKEYRDGLSKDVTLYENTGGSFVISDIGGLDRVISRHKDEIHDNFEHAQQTAGVPVKGQLTPDEIQDAKSDKASYKDAIKEIGSTHKYKLGDKYRNDFDIDGLFSMGLKSDVSWGSERLRKLYDSFESMNYATVSRSLWDALSELGEGDEKKANLYILKFHKAIKDEIAASNDPDRDEFEVIKTEKGFGVSNKSRDNKMSIGRDDYSTEEEALADVRLSFPDISISTQQQITPNASSVEDLVSKNYDNAYELNRGIEQVIDLLKAGTGELTAQVKSFISKYSGMGGLEKFGATGKGLLYEYFTPDPLIERMWGLAYKHGYEAGKPVLEPSLGTARFLKYLPEQTRCLGLEINAYSHYISEALYGNKAEIRHQYFEQLFIKNNASIKNRIDDIEKFSLVIGNPPYGEFTGRFAGMGEKAYTKAGNFIEYFIMRGLDCLVPGGLLIMVIGAEVASGGTQFLDSPMSPVKEKILERGDLIDAYQLPSDLFDRTGVTTQIVIFKKK